MINSRGWWEENKDYSTFPQEKWCDMDFMAVWIRSQGYEPKTSMENLIQMILGYYDNAAVLNGGYFEIPDERPYPNNLMIHIPDVEAYVKANGGLKGFDFVACEH